MYLLLNIPFTLALQFGPKILEVTKSLCDKAIGPDKSFHPFGHRPEDETSSQITSSSVLYAMHQLNDVHIRSQSAT